jgi:hypothetical protein
MRHLGEALVRLARRAAVEAETRRGAVVVFLLALGIWWLEAIALPLIAGRDLSTYLGGYVQLFQSHPIDLGYVLGRTPAATLVIGGVLDVANGVFAEPVVSLLYAGSILAWFSTARRFGGGVAVLTVVVLLLYPGYGILFHELSSDAVFAAGFAGWSLLVVRALQRPSVARFAYAGAGVGLLALIRPSNQILLALAVVPLLLAGPWRRRVATTVAFVVPAVVLLAGWAIHNGIRYDNYTVARGGNATVPFFRTFVTDKIVRPSNGSASEELAQAVRQRLIPKEPYRSYGVTLDDFFAEASPRMQVDLLALSDRIKGWHSNYSWLRDVGFEAIRAHPARYIRGVAGSTSGMLRVPLYRGDVAAAQVATEGGSATAQIGAGALPKPTEGEPIPAAHEGGVTTPDGSIYTVWTSPSEHHLVFTHPGDEQRYDALHARMSELAANLPDRRGSPSVAHRVDQVSRWFPPPIFFLVLGAVILAVRRLWGSVALWVPTVAGLVVIVFTALGLPAEPHYAVPVAPAFMLLTGAALLAPRRSLAPVESWRAALPRTAVAAGPVLGIACGIVAALWAVSAYAHLFSVSQAPHDFGVFLRAAGDFIHGDSPFAWRADETYAYPPFLALLVAPLHPLSVSAATVIWTLVSLAAIAASLWLLGLRDWRCYAFVAVFPFTRSAVDLGTVAPLLLLAVAAAWRWRDRVVEPAIAIGAGIALKLFLWPLLVWPAVTGRVKSAATAVGCAVVLGLLPWALIGFAGLGDYPHLLRRLADDEASSSYSIVALAVRAHLPQGAGVAISIVVAVLILAAAAWVARRWDLSRSDRDVAVLTLALAAALAASPIVWVHYFLLLLVPLALAQPRLSWLWFVPFAYYPLGESAWPAGDARKLGLALAATLLILGAVLYRTLRPIHRPAHEAAERPPARPRPPVRA